MSENWAESMNALVYAPVIRSIMMAIVIFIVGWILSKWFRTLTARVMRKKSLDEALTGFLSALVQYLILAATVITALQTVGVATTSFVALLASAGLAIGLALQGNLGHFASGVMILFFRPFTIGHKITSGGHTGKVQDIGLFATVLATADNETVIIPNGAVTGDSIVNHTVSGTLRGNISVGIAYGSDIESAMQVMLGACKKVDEVLEDPAPSVAFDGFGASSLDFVVRPWAKTGDFLSVLHEAKVALYNDLNDAGIDIPFDQIVVHKAE